MSDKVLMAERAPLPDCRYDDLPAARAGYSDWAQTVLDTIHRLPPDYEPPDLVGLEAAGVAGGNVRRVAIADLAEMVAAAAAAGTPIAANGGFRPYTRQVEIFERNVSEKGHDAAALEVARPGHSEHQLGTTIDFMSQGGKPPWELADWATTRAGRWLKLNAWRYGWVMSYPKRFSPQRTCYIYEPWHYRYFGRDQAREMTESGLSPREWLWAQGYGAAPCETRR